MSVPSPGCLPHSPLSPSPSSTFKQSTELGARVSLLSQADPVPALCEITVPEPLPLWLRESLTLARVKNSLAVHPSTVGRQRRGHCRLSWVSQWPLLLALPPQSEGPFTLFLLPGTSLLALCLRNSHSLSITFSRKPPGSLAGLTAFP